MSDSLEAAAHGYAAIEERKRNMTGEQLKARGLVLAEMVQQEAAIAALRAENAALRQRADEATRAENEACAALMEHLGDNELAGAIRARIAP